MQNEKYKKMKRKGLKKNLLIPQVPIVNKNPCFICGKQGVVASCSNKNCNKYYHLECVNMEVWPEGIQSIIITIILLHIYLFVIIL